MLEIITKNPYRVLGVCSNAQMKDIINNKNRMNAFMHVGRSVSFPIDLANVLGPVERTAATVENADSQLTIESDKLKYAQFWFMNSSTSEDSSAFQLLQSGNVDGALAAWSKSLTMTALQNAAVIYLIKGDYSAAALKLSKLYETYATPFQQKLGINTIVPATTLIETFVGAVKAGDPSVSHDALSPAGVSSTWIASTRDNTVEPLVKKITDAVNTARQARTADATQAFDAGTALIATAKPLLMELRQILGPDDIKFRTTSDKVSNEVLQCAIDYYNQANTTAAARKVKPMMETASMFAMSTMVKQRCKENLDTINSNIANNDVPDEVANEDRFIGNELSTYCQFPDEIRYATILLNNTAAPLNTIRERLGKTHPYYLRISTLVMNNALHNVIEEVNAAQSAFNNAASGTMKERSALTNYIAAVNAAVPVVTRLRNMDLTPEGRQRIDENYSTLMNLKRQCDNIGGGSGTADSDDGNSCLSSIGQWIIYIAIFLLIRACLS